MSGNVFVFNMFSEPLMLILNGAQAATIPGWSRGYQPAAVPVSRVADSDQAAGHFLNGGNHLTLQWPSGSEPAMIQIDGAMFPPNRDLLIFVARNQWQLVNTSGIVVANGAIGSRLGETVPGAQDA